MAKISNTKCIYLVSGSKVRYLLRISSTSDSYLVELCPVGKPPVAYIHIQEEIDSNGAFTRSVSSFGDMKMLQRAWDRGVTRAWPSMDHAQRQCTRAIRSTMKWSANLDSY